MASSGEFRPRRVDPRMAMIRSRPAAGHRAGLDSNDETFLRLLVLVMLVVGALRSIRSEAAAQPPPLRRLAGVRMTTAAAIASSSPRRSRPLAEARRALDEARHEVRQAYREARDEVRQASTRCATRSARRIARWSPTTTAASSAAPAAGPSRPRARKPKGSRCRSCRGRGSPRPRRGRRPRRSAARSRSHPAHGRLRRPGTRRVADRRRPGRTSRSPGQISRDRGARRGRRPRALADEGRRMARARRPRVLDAAGPTAPGHGRRDADRPDVSRSRRTTARCTWPTLTADFSPRRRAELVEAYNRELVQHRLVTLGGTLAFVLICLAAISGYIRADEATKGYYTNRLRMLAAAGVGAAGVIIYKMVA